MTRLNAGPIAQVTTVREQIAQLNLQYSKQLHWQAGAICRERWQSLHGCLPDKDLRPKTLGAGSHMFAVYPVAFAPVIREVLRSLQAADAAQLRLFGEDVPAP